MNYADPELIRQLSAEYVLGTLRGPARRRFERLLDTLPDARAEIGFWEQRLGEFGQELPRIAPPARARDRLLRHATPIPPPAADAADALRRPPRPRIRRRHRWLFAATAAAALVAAFLLGRQTAIAPLTSEPPAVIAAAPTAPGAEASDAAGVPGDSPESPALYLAQLKLPASSMAWLLSVSPDHRKLIAVAADDYYTQGRQRFQLWWISPTRGPLPLAALPAERHAAAVIDIPAEVIGETRVVFAISLEPLSGPRDRKPSGPVLSTTRQIDEV